MRLRAHFYRVGSARQSVATWKIGTLAIVTLQGAGEAERRQAYFKRRQARWALSLTVLTDGVAALWQTAVVAQCQFLTILCDSRRALSIFFDYRVAVCRLRRISGALLFCSSSVTTIQC